jgi:hypothetical protein
MGLTKPRASQIFDIDYKQATRVITVSDVTLAGGAPSQVDGVNLAEDDRVLVTGQNTASQNGLYFVSSVGTGANGTWLRTTDGNENGEVQAGMIVMVTEGSLYHDTQWKLTTNNPIVIGTTALTFVINILSQIGGSNTQIQYNNAGTMGGSANLTWDGTTLYTNGAVSATGNITGNYILGNGSQLSGIITTVDANTLTGTTLAANVVTSSLTSVGTLGSLSVTGNVNSGNLRTAGLISATGAITVGGDISLTGNIVDAAAMIISTSSNGNITLSPNGTGVVVVNKDIQNGQANGVGNIGSATTYFNTVFAKATSAQYADLAENYEADADYTPGTVVVFGGNKEITVTNNSHDTAVAGVVSTNPSYLMNAGQAGEWILPVALTGRVPCRVQGPVNKGTVLVTGDIPGTAMAIDTSKFKPGCVVGKSLEIIDSTDVATIEVAVGRL